MRIQTVYAADTKTADQAKPEPKVEEFKGYKVIDGIIQPGYTDIGYYIPGYSSRSHVASLKNEYDAKAKQEAEGKENKKEEGYSLKSPFIWIGNVFSNLFSFIGDMFKGIFGLCFNYEGETPKAKEGTDDVKTETK